MPAKKVSSRGLGRKTKEDQPMSATVARLPSAAKVSGSVQAMVVSV
jgi:hypothetical protein